MNNTNISKTKFFALGGAAVALYNFLILFMFNFDGEASFWTSLVFANISIILSVVVTYLGIKSVKKMTDWVFSLPIIRWCGIYVVTALVISLIFMLADSYASWKLTFIIQFLLPIFFLILVLPCFAQRAHIEEVNKVTETKVSNLRILHAKLLALVPRCENEAVRKDVEKAADLIRHSDPMSNDSLADIEQKLSNYIDSLDTLVRTGNLEAAAPIAKEVCLLIGERNQLAIATKLTHN